MRKNPMSHLLVSDPNNRLPTEDDRKKAFEAIKKMFPLPLMVEKSSGSVFHYNGYHLWFHLQKDPPTDSFKGFSFSV